MTGKWIWEAAAGLMIPFLGTSLGAMCVLLLKGTLNRKVGCGMAGFAGGVMVAASVWSLLIPAIERAEERGETAFLPAAAGFAAGFLFLLVLDRILPQTPPSEGGGTPDARLRQTYLTVFAVTVHNLPEGMAVGVVFAALASGDPAVTVSAAMALSVGIAVQNFPEGAIVSLPLRSAGVGRGKALLIGVLSGAVELFGAVVTLFAAVSVGTAMPYLLSFAAGAMIYVVVEELIPEMRDGAPSGVGAVSFAVGFLIMMILDVALG